MRRGGIEGGELKIKNEELKMRVIPVHVN